MNEDENRFKRDMNDSFAPSGNEFDAIDAEAHALLSTEKTAVVFYELVKNRMQHVNSWSVIAGKLAAEFQLVNKEGLEVFRKAAEGDYLRIDMKVPGRTSGTGFDWVKVEELQDEPDIFRFRVRPASHPSAHRAIPDHLYANESTSAFQVVRLGGRVIVTISDRAETPHSGNGDVARKAHNASVAWSARARFSQIHWQALANGLVSR